MPQAILLTGGSGAGKTTTAQAVAGLLTNAGHTTGLLDLDAVAQFGPQPPVSRGAAPAPEAVAADAAVGASVEGSGLRFSDQLRIDNLAAVWRTYRAAGAEYLIASGPVTSAELRARYTAALPDCTVQVVRLVTDPELIANRTSATRGPDWDLAAALADAESHAPIEDFLVTNNRPVADTAAEILTLTGWPTG
ncbi:hypothetical protein GCM10009804_49560 [Kribbella hippodromi]|uniref:APS kinase domain-containing protein n=1 Tax=Kribbella hippodromi TaxID=434347 RepID=A0ABN2DV67_9ACTN